MLKLHPSCYGITILQTFIYYKLSPNDPWIFRYSVRNSKPSHLTYVHLSYVVTPVQVALLLYVATKLGTCILYLHALWSAGYLIHSTLRWALMACIFISSNHLEIISCCFPSSLGMTIKSMGSESDFICRSFLVMVFPHLADLWCHESPRALSYSFRLMYVSLSFWLSFCKQRLMDNRYWLTLVSKRASPLANSPMTRAQLPAPQVVRYQNMEMFVFVLWSLLEQILWIIIPHSRP